LKREEAERAQKAGSEVRMKKNGFVFRGRLVMQYGGSDYFIFRGRNGKEKRIECMERAAEFSLRGK